MQGPTPVVPWLHSASHRSSDPTISIVIPARNEARNLEVVLPTLPPVHEVILVDGHSVDDTIAAAQKVLPNIRILEQTRNGKGNALASGFLAATGDIIVMFDADGSADPAEIARFVDALVAGADFVKGSRFRAGGGSEDITPFRHLGNGFLNLVTNVLYGTDFTDLNYGYNAFWRDIVPLFNLPHPLLPPPADGSKRWGDGFEIESLLNCRVALAQLTVDEIPSIERPRIYGESNLTAIRDGLRVLRTILMEKRAAALGRAQARKRLPLKMPAAEIVLPPQVIRLETPVLIEESA